jgi:hypothetical protein
MGLLEKAARAGTTRAAATKARGSPRGVAECSASAPYVAECRGINLYSEHSLHSSIKEYLAGPGDRLEARVEGRVVDLVRSNGELVEVQTRQLGKIAPKVLALAAAGHRLRVVHPLVAEKTIRRLDPKTQELQSTRKSPKRCDIYDLFDELIHASELIASPNVTVEVLFVRAVEVKLRDGSGSWRRRGDRTVDRELVEVLSSRSFRTKSQWLSLIPRSLDPPWSSAGLGEALGIGAERARKLLYCFSRAGLLVEAGKEGRRKLYDRPRATSSSRRPRDA